MTKHAQRAVEQVTKKVLEIRESASRSVYSSTEDGDHFSFRVPAAPPRPILEKRDEADAERKREAVPA